VRPVAHRCTRRNPTAAEPMLKSDVCQEKCQCEAGLRSRAKGLSYRRPSGVEAKQTVADSNSSSKPIDDAMVDALDDDDAQICDCAANRHAIVTVRLNAVCWHNLSAHINGRRPLAIRSILRAIGAAPRPARQPRLTSINITAGCNQRERLK
jgi:hypothetical protein